MVRLAIIFLVSCVIWVSSAHAERAIIINQTNSPLQILSYSNVAKDEIRNGSYYRPSMIVHSTEVKNVGSQRIEAYQIVFISLDVFYDRATVNLGGVSVTSVPMGENSSGDWEQNTNVDFFKNFGIGIAYVKRARLYDGTIWNADMTDVLVQLRDVYSELDASIFEEE